jgi:hypothetical protein
MESMKLSEGGMGATLGRPGAMDMGQPAQLNTIPTNNYSGLGSAPRDNASPEPKGTIDSNPKQNNTDTQMDQLYQEVNQMKKLMAQLKKGHAIGEIFEGSPANEDADLLESIKAQRLQDLKRQR